MKKSSIVREIGKLLLLSAAAHSTFLLGASVVSDSVPSLSYSELVDVAETNVKGGLPGRFYSDFFNDVVRKEILPVPVIYTGNAEQDIKNTLRQITWEYFPKTQLANYRDFQGKVRESISALYNGEDSSVSRVFSHSPHAYHTPVCFVYIAEGANKLAVDHEMSHCVLYGKAGSTVDGIIKYFNIDPTHMDEIRDDIYSRIPPEYQDVISHKSARHIKNRYSRYLHETYADVVSIFLNANNPKLLDELALMRKSNPHSQFYHGVYLDANIVDLTSIIAKKNENNDMEFIHNVSRNIVSHQAMTQREFMNAFVVGQFFEKRFPIHQVSDIMDLSEIDDILSNYVFEY